MSMWSQCRIMPSKAMVFEFSKISFKLCFGRTIEQQYKVICSYFIGSANTQKLVVNNQLVLNCLAYQGYFSDWSITNTFEEHYLFWLVRSLKIKYLTMGPHLNLKFSTYPQHPNLFGGEGDTLNYVKKYIRLPRQYVPIKHVWPIWVIQRLRWEGGGVLWDTL